MSQAEGIRRYVLTHYVDPARAAGEDELTIRAGDVCRAMGLQGRTPNVCSVLGSRKFLAMAGLRLLGRVGPARSTTTTYCYALGGQRIGAESAPTTGAGTASRRAGERPDPAAQRRGQIGDAKPIVVIACAGSKSAAAGHLTLGNGRRIGFVADPRVASRVGSTSYRHPDDAAHSGLTWRQVLAGTGLRGAIRADSCRRGGSTNPRPIRACIRIWSRCTGSGTCSSCPPDGGSLPPGFSSRTMTSHSRRRQAPRSEGGGITDSTISRCCRR